MDAFEDKESGGTFARTFHREALTEQLVGVHCNVGFGFVEEATIEQVPNGCDIGVAGSHFSVHMAFTSAQKGCNQGCVL